MAVTTSDRLLNVLGLFTYERPTWTVEGAAEVLNMAVSTAYRYFRSLAKAGLIVSSTTGVYVLGPAIIQYDRQIRLLDPVTTSAKPIMGRLAAELPGHVIILLCRLFRNQVICVHQESREQPHFATSYERGRPMPLFRGATSKSILAHLSPRTLKALYAADPAVFKRERLGASWEEAKQRLRELRNASMLITQAELDPGMTGLAVPIFDPTHAVIGSLSIVLERRNLSQKLVESTTQKLRDASREITWALSVIASGHNTAFVEPAAGERPDSRKRKRAVTDRPKRRAPKAAVARKATRKRALLS